MKRFSGRLVSCCCLAAAQVQAQGAIHDYYTPTIEWRQASGFEVTPIHVGLLPNGKLFFINNFNFFENPGMNLTARGFEPEYLFLMQPTPADSPPPAFVVIEPLANPPALRPVFDSRANTLRLKTLVCSGHSLLAGGELFIAGGPDALIDLNLYNSGNLFASLTVDGIAESFAFNPSTGSWKQNPNTVAPGPATGASLRWYPTVTRLADARMLVTGGYEKVSPRMLYNSSVEVFDPASNSWSIVSAGRDTPEGVENPDYPHVFQFPSAGAAGNTVMMIGGSGEPLFLTLGAGAGSWRHTNHYRPGAKEYLDAAAPEMVFPNKTTSSALLPLRLPEGNWGYANGSVINVGGAHQTPLGRQIDVYDPAAGAWRPSISMNGSRHHPSTVLLPDGRVLILAGWQDESPINQIGYAEYVDPRNGFTLSRGTAFMPETRGYHTVTVLLPDGRVLVGSGNVAGEDARELTTFRYYYPDYMFKTRPQIVSSEDTIAIGGSSFVTVPHNARISEAALVGLGAMTHSFDMSQRHVQVRVFDAKVTVRLVDGQWAEVEASQCVDASSLCYDKHLIEAPVSEELAPPGYYMLFILDENRVPSSGAMLKVQSRLPPWHGKVPSRLGAPATCANCKVSRPP